MRRLDPLTSLRFFAAAMIVMYHAGGRGLGPAWPMSFALGQGVTFFFVLSGFVLAYNHANLRGFHEIRDFYVARFARIWPSHVATGVMYVLLIGNISYFSLPEESRALITLAYVTLTHAWVPVSEYITAYNTVSWSISTEFFFYLLFPILIMDWARTWKVKLLLTLVIAVAMLLFADMFAIAPNGTEDGRGNLGYINPLARIFEFALGVGVCHLYLKFGGKYSSAWMQGRGTAVETVVCVLAVFGLWCSHWLASDPAAVGVIGKTAALFFSTRGFGTFIFAGLIFVFAVGAGRLSAILSKRPFVFLGEISFGLYLVHTLFLLYRQQAPGVFAGMSDAQVFGLYWLTGLSLATLLHFGVEQPCQAMIRSIASPNRQKALGFRRHYRALVGFGIAVMCLVVVQPSTRITYSEAQQAANLLKAPVQFSGGYRLLSVEVESGVAKFGWRADDDLSLSKRVAVHLLNGKGEMIGQFDFALETGFRSAAKGESWSNVVALGGVDMLSVHALGIAVYDNREMKQVVSADQVIADWNDTRLIVPFGSAGVGFVERASGRGAFAAEILPAAVEGDWLAGDGIATVSLKPDSVIALVTETGLPGDGVILGDRLAVAGWGVEARLSADGQQLQWSNGFVWRRGGTSK